MYKLEHVIRNTILSKKIIFVVLERWLIYGTKTGHSFVYLIVAVLLF